MARQQLVVVRRGGPESRQVGGRMAGWAGLTSWCPVFHTVLENTDRQTPWRDRRTDEEYLFGDSLCLHLQWLRKQLRAQKKRQQTEGDLTAL